MKLAREGWPIAGVVAGLALVGGLLWIPLGLVLFGFLLFTLWFFRDPERSVPQQTDLLVSPADGTVLRASPEIVSIFMNVFNVHVCRAPAAGRVASVKHTPGRFLAAFKDEAPLQNERARIEMTGSDGKTLAFTLIAGLVARRIVCRIAPGQQLAVGQRVGLIRFGSRVDLELPPGATTLVRPGQRVRAGETPLARVVLDTLGRQHEAAEAVAPC